MTFEDYLISKKIDTKAFAQAEPELWQEWKNLFDQISPSSFTAQKLYLVNPIRRRFPLKETAGAEAKTDKPQPVITKPVFKPKIK